MDKCGNAEEIIPIGISNPSFPPSVATSSISSVARYGRLQMIRSNSKFIASAELQHTTFWVLKFCSISVLKLISMER